MGKIIIRSETAPQAIGPYSQAVQIGPFLFTSGQIPLDAGGNLVEGPMEVQALQVLTNLGSILESAGYGWSDVVKTTVYLADMNDFAALNRVYADFFPGECPARTTIQAARLPKDARLEIELIACMEKTEL